jgi:hypothetical protein
LLLRGPESQSADQGISLWRSRRYILNQLILQGLNARGSSGDPSLLFSTVCRDAILLSQSHVNQLTEGIRLDKVQTFLELSAQTSTKTILLFGIIISIITRILTQVIKSLCILQYGVGALSKCQELSQFPFHQPFRYMMCPEGIPEFFLGDNMAISLYSTIIIPPNTGSSA